VFHFFKSKGPYLALVSIVLSWIVIGSITSLINKQDKNFLCEFEHSLSLMSDEGIQFLNFVNENKDRNIIYDRYQIIVGSLSGLSSTLKSEYTFYEYSKELSWVTYEQKNDLFIIFNQKNQILTIWTAGDLTARSLEFNKTVSKKMNEIGNLVMKGSIRPIFVKPKLFPIPEIGGSENMDPLLTKDFSESFFADNSNLDLGILKNFVVTETKNRFTNSLSTSRMALGTTLQKPTNESISLKLRFDEQSICDQGPSFILNQLEENFNLVNISLK